MDVFTVVEHRVGRNADGDNNDENSASCKCCGCKGFNVQIPFGITATIQAV